MEVTPAPGPPLPLGAPAPLTYFQQSRLRFEAWLGDVHATADLFGSPVALDGAAAASHQVRCRPEWFGRQQDLGDAVDELVAAVHRAVPVLTGRAVELADLVHGAAAGYREDDRRVAASYDGLAAPADRAGTEDPAGRDG